MPLSQKIRKHCRYFLMNLTVTIGICAIGLFGQPSEKIELQGLAQGFDIGKSGNTIGAQPLPFGHRLRYIIADRLIRVE